MEKYTKINTMYKRYIFTNDDCPNEKWLKMKNKIILGDFSNKEAEYLFDCKWEAYSKIDGTNSKIAYFPSTKEVKVEGKDENSQSQKGQFEFLTELAMRIKPKLEELFPPESERFVPQLNAENGILYEISSDGSERTANVKFVEEPIYIYGEYYGDGIQKCGKRYVKGGHRFSVFDIKKQGWWTPKDVRDSICSELGLEQVPFIGYMTLMDIENLVRGGFTTKVNNAEDPTLIEEGIVCRPPLPLFCGRNRVIVKVKYEDYVKYGQTRKEFSDEEFEEFTKWYNNYTPSIENGTNS